MITPPHKLKLSDEMREKFRAESPTLRFCDEPGFALCDQAHFDRIWATMSIPAIERQRKGLEEATKAEHTEPSPLSA